MLLRQREIQPYRFGGAVSLTIGTRLRVSVVSFRASPSRSSSVPDSCGSVAIVRPSPPAALYEAVSGYCCSSTHTVLVPLLSRWLPLSQRSTKTRNLKECKWDSGNPKGLSSWAGYNPSVSLTASTTLKGQEPEPTCSRKLILLPKHCYHTAPKVRGDIGQELRCIHIGEGLLPEKVKEQRTVLRGHSIQCPDSKSDFLEESSRFGLMLIPPLIEDDLQNVEAGTGAEVLSLHDDNLYTVLGEA